MTHLPHAAAVLAFVATATPSLGQTTVIMGSVGSSSANSWATYVAVEKGLVRRRRD